MILLANDSKQIPFLAVKSELPIHGQNSFAHDAGDNVGSVKRRRADCLCVNHHLITTIGHIANPRAECNGAKSCPNACCHAHRTRLYRGDQDTVERINTAVLVVERTNSDDFCMRCRIV